MLKESINLARQMERFLDPLDLFHIFIREEATVQFALSVITLWKAGKLLPKPKTAAAAFVLISFVATVLVVTSCITYCNVSKAA